MIKRGVDNETNFIVGEPNFWFQLGQFGSKGLHIMDFDSLGSQFFCNCFLLHIEITELFFPHLDFVENSFDIILRIAHIFSNFQHLTQVHDNFFGLKFVGSRDQTAHILRLYLLHRSRVYFAWWSLLLRRSERSNTSGLHATSSGINVIPGR